METNMRHAAAKQKAGISVTMLAVLAGVGGIVAFGLIYKSPRERGREDLHQQMDANAQRVKQIQAEADQLVADQKRESERLDKDSEFRIEALKRRRSMERDAWKDWVRKAGWGICSSCDGDGCQKCESFGVQKR